MTLDAVVHSRQVLPDVVEAFALIKRKIIVAEIVFGLGEGLGTRSEEGHQLIDICRNDVDLMLNIANAVVPVTACPIDDAGSIRRDAVELHPVDLTFQNFVLGVEPLAHLPLSGDIGVGDASSGLVIRKRKLRSPVARRRRHHG